MARSQKPRELLRYLGPRRPFGIVVTDAAGNPCVLELGEGLEIVDGVIRVNKTAVGAGGGLGEEIGSSCEPLVLGEELVFFDGDVVMWCD